MLTFILIVAILSLIAIFCLKRRFSMGIIPIIILSCIFSGVTCVIINTITWNPRVYCEENITVGSNLGGLKYGNVFNTDYSIDEIDSVIISDTIKNPTVISKILKRESKGILINYGYDTKLKTKLVLNKNDYKLYKSFKASLEKRKKSL